MARLLTRHGMQDVLGSSSSCAISFPVTFRDSLCVRAQDTSSKGTVSSVPAWFRADPRTNLI